MIIICRQLFLVACLSIRRGQYIKTDLDSCARCCSEGSDHTVECAVLDAFQDFDNIRCCFWYPRASYTEEILRDVWEPASLRKHDHQHFQRSKHLEKLHLTTIYNHLCRFPGVFQCCVVIILKKSLERLHGLK